MFAVPTPAELATGTVWPVNLTTPANTNLATGLPQVLTFGLERLISFPIFLI